MPPLTQRVDSLVADIVAEFSAGDLPRLALHFDFPLAMYVEHRLWVMHRPEDLTANFADIVDKCRKAGPEPVAARVVAMDLPRNNRFRAWAQFTHCDAAGEPAHKSDWILYCRDSNPRIAVEMLHVTRLADLSRRP